MAESLSIIGAAGAVSQLTSELVKLTTNLRHHLKVMRRAPHEVQCFLMETSNFTCLLNSFTELADRPVQNTERRDQRKREKMVSEIEQQCTYVRDKMEYLVDRFAVLTKGNMTPLEGLLERIKYLLDKPDIKDLRLSLQIAALTVNCMSTLFAWEEAAMKDDTRTASLLEQLKNLLPMAKKASTELAEHQRKHGTTYESGVPDPNNAMLAASEEIQRQIAHAIRPHSHAEATKDRTLGDKRRERRRTSPVERTGQSEAPWASPFGPDGLVADSVEYIPRRNRVSFKTSDDVTDGHSSDQSTGTRQDGGIAPVAPSTRSRSPPVQPPGPDNKRTSYVYLRDSGGKSSDKVKQIEANATAHESNTTETHPESRRSEPRIHQCNRRCAYIYCTLCSGLHCSRDWCPPSDKPGAKEGTPSPNKDTSTSRGVSPLSELPKTGSSAGSSREDTRPPPPPLSSGGQARYTLPIPTDSEASGLSDKEPDPHWSGTNPSSKSSSPSTRGPAEIPVTTTRRRNSMAARRPPSGDGLRETQESRAGSGVRDQVGLEQDKEQDKEQEQGQHRGSPQRRRLDAFGKRLTEDQQRHPLGSTGPRALDGDGSGRDASFAGERPPGVPGPPSRGPSERRRPRRPRPKTMML
ncbi:hypothetical protein F5Y12DRAFT_516550 [Xylaria sp. FL1777]|nr:hypothetical protein F5Y12DRAFT_516550 [Xylaria sp. FL1777]